MASTGGHPVSPLLVVERPGIIRGSSILLLDKAIGHLEKNELGGSFEKKGRNHHEHEVLDRGRKN